VCQEEPRISLGVGKQTQSGGVQMSKLRFIDIPSIMVLAVAAGVPLLVALL
jgi:hypothetical protein